MKKIEIIFKLSEKARKPYTWKKFYKYGITLESIHNIIDDISITYNTKNPVILSLREIPYINK